MYRLNFCQGENSEHVVILGDAKRGKTRFVREHILGKLPSTFKYWIYDHTKIGFPRCGTPIDRLEELIDANMQYKPHTKDEAEFSTFIMCALALGNRIVVLDEFNNYQKSKYINDETALFLRTARHVNISWIVIAQDPLELNEIVFRNMDHLFVFYMSPVSRHFKKLSEWFGEELPQKLIRAPKGAYLHYQKGGEIRLYPPFTDKWS